MHTKLFRLALQRCSGNPVGLMVEIDDLPARAPAPRRPPAVSHRLVAGPERSASSASGSGRLHAPAKQRLLLLRPIQPERLGEEHRHLPPGERRIWAVERWARLTATRNSRSVQSLDVVEKGVSSRDIVEVCNRRCGTKRSTQQHLYH